MQPTPKRKYFQILKISNYLLAIGTIIFLMMFFSCNSSNQENKTTPTTAQAQDTVKRDSANCEIRFKYLRMKVDTFCKYFKNTNKFRKFVFQPGIEDINQNPKEMGLICFAIGKDPLIPGKKYVVLNTFWLEEEPTKKPIPLSGPQQIYATVEMGKDIAKHLDCIDCTTTNNYLLFSPMQDPTTKQIYYQVSTTCKMTFTSVDLNPSPPAKPGKTN